MTPTFSGTQLGRKTRVGCIIHDRHFVHEGQFVCEEKVCTLQKLWNRPWSSDIHTQWMTSFNRRLKNIITGVSSQKGASGRHSKLADLQEFTNMADIAV
jgi:hypothetical protein